MKNSERFNRAIKGLVKGFFNGTLVKGDCKACAVANIVAEAVGAKISIIDNEIATDKSIDDWGTLFSTGVFGGQRQCFTLDAYVKERHPDGFEHDNIYTMTKINFQQGVRNIDATGYSIEEMARVEFAFEQSAKIYAIYDRRHSKDEITQDQYNGLIAVVEVLCKIEGIDDKETKAMFEYNESFEPVNAIK